MSFLEALRADSPLRCRDVIFWRVRHGSPTYYKSLDGSVFLDPKYLLSYCILDKDMLLSDNWEVLDRADV